MRSRFDEKLITLHNSLIEMGSLIEFAISNATNALLEQDIALSNNVINGDYLIDEKENEIESLCLKLLLSQQPVALDLRKISTALKMITDMERIGDQAADISEISVYLLNYDRISEFKYIQQMANTTIKMVKTSIDAYIKKDLSLAQNVIDSDDIVDDLYVKIKKDLISLVHDDASTGEQAFDLLLIAKYYERIGDHAVNIAEWVIFSITGKHRDNKVF